MFGQKFTNTNEMIQCTDLHCADFVAAKLAQLNTALNVFLHLQGSNRPTVVHRERAAAAVQQMGMGMGLV
jgi:hypothetical protein